MLIQQELHSEYRSTYRWHEYTGPRQEVVRRPPQANAVPNTTVEKSNDIQHSTKEEDSIAKLEPAMPRRKKYPDLAYRHHEFLISDGGANEAADSRARGRDGGLFRKAISKISTEYRLQFAWPSGHTSRRDQVDSSAPRKSQSMGALKANANAAMVHKKRIDMENRDASELEPLVDGSQDRSITREEFDSEYKKKFRPFSHYEYNEGRFMKRGTNEVDGAVHEATSPHCENKNNDSWYREVVELRKKAGEYKNRGWGTKFAPERLNDMYNKQVELWDQVSRRSSLSALSLASMAHKSYTKEEKEEDNNKKSSPSKAYRNAENSARMIRDIIRHHLERTTGGSEFDGLILSPTREKLEPTIPRKDDDSRGSQKNSPKKNSPIKSSSLKRTNQKAKVGPKKLRSQSVGPVTELNSEKRSPKRQSRSATVKERKSSGTTTNKRPRPSDASKTDTNNTAVGVDVKTNNEEPESLTYEPVVKSPPEPTRVKSPEQILMRSPDPVNWTVPLDTGKTFTVTQNVKEGDISTRPHSEVKAWTPPDIPPPIAQSAPPTLTDQNKEQGMDLAVKA